MSRVMRALWLVLSLATITLFGIRLAPANLVLSSGAGPGPGNVAVDSSGNVVVDSAGNVVRFK